jgi:hypothetical protein
LVLVAYGSLTGIKVAAALTPIVAHHAGVWTTAEFVSRAIELQ